MAAACVMLEESRRGMGLTEPTDLNIHGIVPLSLMALLTSPRKGESEIRNLHHDMNDPHKIVRTLER
jgi:hypothetical protein